MTRESSAEESNLDRRVGDSQSLQGEPSESQTAADQAYSAREVLRSKDFARLTPEELAEVRRTIHTMAWELEHLGRVLERLGSNPQLAS